MAAGAVEKMTAAAAIAPTRYRLVLVMTPILRCCGGIAIIRFGRILARSGREVYPPIQGMNYGPMIGSPVSCDVFFSR